MVICAPVKDLSYANDVTEEKVPPQGKPVALQLAPKMQTANFHTGLICALTMYQGHIVGTSCVRSHVPYLASLFFI